MFFLFSIRWAKCMILDYCCKRVFKAMLLFTYFISFPTPAMYFYGQREGKSTLMTPERLMAARKMMGDRVAHTAAEEFQKGKTMPNSTPHLGLTKSRFVLNSRCGAMTVPPVCCSLLLPTIFASWRRVWC